MRNIRFYTKTGFVILSVLLLSVFWVAATVDANKNISNPNLIVNFAIQYHMVILIALILISVLYGFLWSSLSYHEIMKKKKTSKSILETVFLFLSPAEKGIIQFLMQKKGLITQAEISRLPGMNRVKAFRLLRNMRNKNLVEIIPHGKIRRVMLKENIMDTLLEKP
ncbi:hypothetical protein J4470_01690 [Candidatus Woesearchaeota archaeon]|nr:hypothetical protein [Candidatus Woesearchaeota archaeon]